MQKVIIAGSRNFARYDILKNTLNRLFKERFIVVSGCAAGADAMGERYAQEYNYEVEQHPAKWDDLDIEPCFIKTNARGKQYNALAGHNRNLEMLQSVLNNPDGGCLVAFWDGESRGTKNMISIATNAGIKVHVIQI